MLLVCDSGSTKADWMFSDGKTVSGPFNTIGFNPYFHTSEFVFETLQKDRSLESLKDKVEEIFFYGAGCSSPERDAIIATGLHRYFPKAKILVDHDLLACALATCGDQPGISCIIGTGSNSCWFDGKKVHERNYGLGFILGDEGSGSYYGKKLITQFLYDMMPEEIHEAFKNKYNLTRDSSIDHVYRMKNANVWLSSFAKFLTDFRDHDYIKNLVRKGMREFLELYVCHYENYEKEKTHFVGSIAFLFQEELKMEAESLNIQVGKIIRQPIQDLMEFFLRNRG